MDVSPSMPAPIGISPPLATRPVRRLSDQRVRRTSGRRVPTHGEPGSGAHLGSKTPTDRLTDLDIAATLRVAAPRQVVRNAASFDVAPGDLRQRVRRTRARTLTVFIVDASGSMGARRGMEATKGAILSLLLDAYQRRDRVALVTVRGAGAHLALPPTDSVEVAHRALERLATGGRTPLWAGLESARQLIEAERRRDPSLLALTVLVSDGRSNVPRGDLDPTEATRRAAEALRATGARALVVDTERGYVRMGLAAGIARALTSDYVRLDADGSQNLAAVVRRARG